MRRQLYLAAGTLLLSGSALVVLYHSHIWFLYIAIPILCLWLHDILQSKRAILRNFPVLGHFRYLLESIRPEIRQYFIAGPLEERPFNRQMREVIYRRSKGERETVPFGTEQNITAVGYEWILHSMIPKSPKEIEPRMMVGGPKCKQTYHASRLNISAMSFGSLSHNAIEALNLGAKIGGFYHNTGEGGISYSHLLGGDVVWQIGTGYFGCRNENGQFDAKKFVQNAKKSSVKMIEIKLSQGAKPAHGGILPAAKITPEIASIRGVPMGEDVLSPITHSAFANPLELMDFIQELRDLSEGKPVGLKLCLGRRTEWMAIVKAMLETNIMPDFITVDGAEGGTGAAPMEYSNHIGVPLVDALIFIHNSLVGAGIREHICIIASGKVVTGFDMITKLALGADMCNSARAMMMALGCIQSQQCNANTCPTGVATSDRRLAKGLVVSEKKHRVESFHERTMDVFLELIGAMGLDNPSQLRPSLIMRRVAPDQVLSYDQIYHYLEPGSILDKTADVSYMTYWNKARSDSFI